MALAWAFTAYAVCCYPVQFELSGDVAIACPRRFFRQARIEVVHGHAGIARRRLLEVHGDGRSAEMDAGESTCCLSRRTLLRRSRSRCFGCRR